MTQGFLIIQLEKYLVQLQYLWVQIIEKHITLSTNMEDQIIHVQCL